MVAAPAIEGDPVEWAGRCLDEALQLAYDKGRVDDAIEALQRVVEVLSPLDPEPHLLGLVEYNLADLHRQRPAPDPEDARDAAISTFERCITRALDPVVYSRAYGSLGDLYARRTRGDRADNQERALEAYGAALLLTPPTVEPPEWAINSHHLGLTLLERVSGDPIANAAGAVSAHWQAAAVTIEADPHRHALAIHGCAAALGELDQRLAGQDRPSPYEVARPVVAGDDAGLIARARATVAVAAVERRAHLVLGAEEADRIARMLATAAQEATDAGLASLAAAAWVHVGRVHRLVAGDEAANAAAAREHLTRALPDLDPRLHPWAWARARQELADLDAAAADDDDPLDGNVEDLDLDRALRHYEGALQARTPERDPVGWAAVQHQRGRLYLARRRGNPEENLRAAVGCFTAALRVRTREHLPERWADTRYALGRAYLAMGAWSQTLECLADAQTVYGRETAPARWAAIRYTLADAAVRRGDLETADGILAEVLELPLEVDEPALYARVLALAGAVALRLGVQRDDETQRWRGMHALRRALDRFLADGDLAAGRDTAAELATGLMAGARPDLAAAVFQAALDADAEHYAATMPVVAPDGDSGTADGLARRTALAYSLVGRYEKAVTALERSRVRALSEALGRDRAALHALLDGDEQSRAAAQRYLEAAARIRRLAAQARLSAGFHR